MRSSLVVLALALAACGGGSKSTPVVNAPAPSASAASGAPGVSTPPPGLPPMATMPPPGVAGSKKAKRKPDAALVSCGGGGSPAAKDPVAEVKRVGEACAAASKMRPLGAMIRGTQGDKDAHQEHKLRVEANKCYRVYFATDENVKDAVLVLRDSAGDMVAESPSAALPDDGAICFTQADEVTLMVGVGSGKGAYAAQVWSD